MICRFNFFCLSIFLLLFILPFQVGASQISKDFSKIIEHFSVWKTLTESSIASLKSSPNIPPREIRALRFMYIPVRSNVNSLIVRMIFDLKSMNNNIDSERYTDSLLNAQRSVNDLNNYINNSILPFTQQKGEEDTLVKVGGSVVFTVAVGVVSLVGATLTIIDFLEKHAEKSEREKIINSLEKIKLSAFDDIRPLNEKKEK